MSTLNSGLTSSQENTYAQVFSVWIKNNCMDNKVILLLNWKMHLLRKMFLTLPIKLDTASFLTLPRCLFKCYSLRDLFSHIHVKHPSPWLSTSLTHLVLRNINWLTFVTKLNIHLEIVELTFKKEVWGKIIYESILSWRVTVKLSLSPTILLWFLV